MHTLYRQITQEEIQILEAHGCRCDRWTDVQVAEPFAVTHYRNVWFSGTVRLGSAACEVTRSNGLRMPSGIFDATVHNCTIGNCVLINKIGNYISDYDIADHTIIENVGRIAMTGASTFGNGVEVSVLNETGGREVPICNCLSAQVAYMLAMYRHDEGLTRALRGMVQQYTEARRSNRGHIGQGCRIVNAGTIRDVWIGDNAWIDGAAQLVNGSIMSTQEAPVRVGINVMARDFIMQDGAVVDEGAVVAHAYVGQATSITRLFSAHDSLFFANCTLENGEAAAVFGGPYTVSMHKSSLLIAGMFSFLNAGSGSNQSNHLYKLGPIHQGVVERGSKTTSDSYMLWPAHIGAFSLVMGRHVTHPDTTRLPFSYLIEVAGESHLVPGVNLKSVGTIRDTMKWPKRDKRHGSRRLDLINFNLLSPFTVEMMMDGIELLNDIERTSGATSNTYSFQGMTIRASALRKGREYYRLAVEKFMGNSLIQRLSGPEPLTDAVIAAKMAVTTANSDGTGPWTDISGMIAPKRMIDALMGEVKQGGISSLEQLDNSLSLIHASYYDLEWTWVHSQAVRWWGKPAERLTADDVRGIVADWLEAVVTLDRLLLEDARKEYSSMARIGFGIYNSQNATDEDFEHVRGQLDADPFVRMVRDHIVKKTALAEAVTSRLRS